MAMTTRQTLTPVGIFAALAALYLTITIIGGSDLLFKPVWDIDHYRTIAERGYEVYPCDPAIHYPLGKICGNVGWFPAWPIALKVLSLGQVALGLKILPYLFGLFGFMLFFSLLVRLADGKAALIGTIALAATPNAFYYLTGFPYSFILFIFTAYLHLLYTPSRRGRRYLLPLTAFCLSLSYPSAFLAALIPTVMVFNQYRRRTPTTTPAMIARELLYHLIPFALGPLMLSLYFYIKFDDLLLIIHFQEKYARNWAFPLTVIWDSLLQFPALYVENASALFYGLAFLLFAPYRLKPELVVFAAVLFFFSPATGSITSVYRHYIILFPVAMMMGTSQRPLWVKIAYIALGLALALFRFYPIFMGGRLI